MPSATFFFLAHSRKPKSNRRPKTLCASPPVWNDGQSGSFGRVLIDRWPPLRGSISSPVIPLRAPNTIPTLAFGHLAHHFCMIASPVVASFTPCCVNGCFAAFLPQSFPHEQ